MSSPVTTLCWCGILLLSLTASAGGPLGCTGANDAPSDAGTEEVAGRCGPGLEPREASCIPVFSECGEREVPLLGGACKAVGPSPKCLAGWAKGSDGWCEPILPKEKCPSGTLELLGHDTCQALGACGSGTYGNIKATASTRFVNRTYTGGASDGTQARPFTTINQALSAAPAGSVIAIAEGEYPEDLTIQRKVTLDGRCPQMVKIRGTGKSDYSTVEVYAEAVLRGISVTGPKEGISVTRARLVLDRVAVENCGQSGLVIIEGADATINDSLIAGNHAEGVSVGSAQATLTRSVIRDTLPQASTQAFGTGLYANRDTGPATLVLRDCLVANNRSLGIGINGSHASIERSVIRDTQPQASDKMHGTGIAAYYEGGPSTLQMSDSVVSGNRYHGLVLMASGATLERIIVRDTQPRAADGAYGGGIASLPDTKNNPAPPLTLRDSALFRNHFYGLGLKGLIATVERSAVCETRPAAPEQIGVGIFGRLSTLTLREVLVSKNHMLGLNLESASSTLERVVVRDSVSQPNVTTGETSLGILARAKEGPSTLVLRESVVSGHQGGNLSLSSTVTTVLRCVVRDARATSSREYGDGITLVRQTEAHPATLELADTLVENSARAGLLLYQAGGDIRRSVFRRALLAIDLEKGANPTISEDNAFEENSENTVTSGRNLAPAPLPDLPSF